MLNARNVPHSLLTLIVSIARSVGGGGATERIPRHQSLGGVLLQGDPLLVVMH